MNEQTSFTGAVAGPVYVNVIADVDDAGKFNVVELTLPLVQLIVTVTPPVFGAATGAILILLLVTDGNDVDGAPVIVKLERASIVIVNDAILTKLVASVPLAVIVIVTVCAVAGAINVAVIACVSVAIHTNDVEFNIPADGANVKVTPPVPIASVGKHCIPADNTTDV